MEKSGNQFIQIFNVRPSSTDELKQSREHIVSVEIDQSTPAVVKKHRMNSDVKVFVLLRPFRKTKEKSGNEFRDLWINKTFFTTSDSFPTTHRRSEIVETETVIANEIARFC
jgi:hypothetical protein